MAAVINLIEYIGIPYVWRGRDIMQDGGLDCWGLMRYYYLRELNVVLPSMVDMMKPEFDRADAMLALEILPRHTQEIPAGAQRLNDFITFHIGPNASHCGIVLNDHQMLHTRKGVNSCIDNYTSIIWRDRIEGFYRYDASIPLPQ